MAPCSFSNVQGSVFHHKYVSRHLQCNQFKPIFPCPLILLSSSLASLISVNGAGNPLFKTHCHLQFFFSHIPHISRYSQWFLSNQSWKNNWWSHRKSSIFCRLKKNEAQRSKWKSSWRKVKLRFESSDAGQCYFHDTPLVYFFLNIYAASIMVQVIVISAYYCSKDFQSLIQCNYH